MYVCIIGEICNSPSVGNHKEPKRNRAGLSQQFVTTMTSFTSLPAISPPAVHRIATHSIPDRLYCL